MASSTPNPYIVITRNDEVRRQVLDRLREQLGVGLRRDGVHVSDLILCTRKAWAERVLAFAENVSDTTVLTWIRGLSHEEILASGTQQVRSGYCFPCQKNWPADPLLADNGWHCPVCGDTLMVGTIDDVTLVSEDGVTLDDFIPTEMKSTFKSSKNRLDEGAMAWFGDQICTYMAMHGRKEGRVFVLHNQGDYRREEKDVRSEGPPADFFTYDVHWRSEHDLENWLEVMRGRKAELEDETRMPALGPNSPVHEYICDYCIVGEHLPGGQECERWPWRLERSTGKYVRKGSARVDMSMTDMLAELEAITERRTTETLEQATEGIE